MATDKEKLETLRVIVEVINQPPMTNVITKTETYTGSSDFEAITALHKDIMSKVRQAYHEDFFRALTDQPPVDPPVLKKRWA